MKGAGLHPCFSFSLSRLRSIFLTQILLLPLTNWHKAKLSYIITWHFLFSLLSHSSHYIPEKTKRGLLLYR